MTALLLGFGMGALCSFLRAVYQEVEWLACFGIKDQLLGECLYELLLPSHS